MRRAWSALYVLVWVFSAAVNEDPGPIAVPFLMWSFLLKARWGEPETVTRVKEKQNQNQWPHESMFFDQTNQTTRETRFYNPPETYYPSPINARKRMRLSKQKKITANTYRCKYTDGGSGATQYRLGNGNMPQSTRKVGENWTHKKKEPEGMFATSEWRVWSFHASCTNGVSRFHGLDRKSGSGHVRSIRQLRERVFNGRFIGRTCRGTRIKRGPWFFFLFVCWRFHTEL